MSPTGININKKQMDLCRGQLSINQATRPLTANMAQVGAGRLSHGLEPPPPHPVSGHSGPKPGMERDLAFSLVTASG